MGFWGKLGKIFSVAGPIAASFIPGGAAVSAGLKALKIGLGVGGMATGGILAGKAIGKELSQDDANSKALREQGARLFGAGAPGYEAAMGTYGKLAGGDKDTLAQFTGTGIDDLNRSLSNQITRTKSNLSRGGASAQVLAEAPGELERSALGLRSDARKFGLEKQGTLGLAGAEAGNQATAEAGSLGLQRRGQNIGIARDLGEGVGTILDKMGVWNKLGGQFGKIFGPGGGGSPMPGTDLPGFSDTMGPGPINLPGFDASGIGGGGGSSSPLSMGKSLNLDMFGAKPNVDSGSMFSGIQPSTGIGPLERVFGKGGGL